MLALKAYIGNSQKQINQKVISSEDRTWDLWGSSKMLFSLS